MTSKIYNFLIGALVLLSIANCHKKNKYIENFDVPEEPTNQYITIEEKPEPIPKTPAIEQSLLDNSQKEDSSIVVDAGIDIPPSGGPTESIGDPVVGPPVQPGPVPGPAIPAPIPEDSLLDEDLEEDDDELIIRFACGNGIVTKPEKCDDGNKINNDGCNNLCGLALCGNCIVDYGEECDTCNPAGKVPGCTVNCLLIFCGNGRHDLGEECDDGNNDPGDCCSPTCLYEKTTICFPPKEDDCDEDSTDCKSKKANI